MKMLDQKKIEKLIIFIDVVNKCMFHGEAWSKTTKKLDSTIVVISFHWYV